MNELKETTNYNMQDLANMLGKTLENTNNLASAIANVAKNQDAMCDMMEDMQNHQKKSDEKLKKLDTRLTNVEENEEITFSQQENIRNAVSRRVYTLLNIPRKRDERSLADKVAVKKYASLFHRRCYSETQKKGHLMEPYRTTPKKNYDQAMKDIEAWWPSNGVDGLKVEAEENAIAKKIAEADLNFDMSRGVQ